MAIFKPGGALTPGDVVNIRRKELDGILLQAEQEGLYIALRSSRQTGKTTLLFQAQDELQGKGYGVVYLDLEGLGDLDKSAFYRHLCNEIQKQLKLNKILPPDSNIKTENVVDQLSFKNYLAAVSKDTMQRARRVILMLDEVGGVPDDVTPTFLSAIRSVFIDSRSPTGGNYRQLKFVFAGAMDLHKCVCRNSPLENVCERFTLDDFSLEQTGYLVDKLANLTEEKKTALTEAIYHWAEGHPYLTQRLCYLIENSPEYQNGVLKDPQAFVKSLAEDKIVYADLPDPNLNHISGHLPDNRGYIEILRRILEGEKVGGSGKVHELSIIGVIKRDKRYYNIRNEIYREALSCYLEEYSNG